MSLVLTRRAGEALILRRRCVDGKVRSARVYVVSVEGNTVRLAVDAAPECEIVREELLAAGEDSPRMQRKAGGGRG